MKGSFDQKLVRFIIAGIINTVFGYSVFSSMIFFGMSYSLALLIATICGIVFNYFSFGRIVYNNRYNTLGFIKIIFSYGVAYVFNIGALFILNNYFFINMYLGQFICTPFNVLLSSLLINYWVYKD